MQERRGDQHGHPKKTGTQWRRCLYNYFSWATTSRTRLTTRRLGPSSAGWRQRSQTCWTIASYIQTGSGPQRYGEDQDVAGSFSPELGTQVGTLKFSWSDDNGNVQTQYTLNFVRPIIRGQDIFIPGRFARTQMLKGDLVVFQAILDPKKGNLEGNLGPKK